MITAIQGRPCTRRRWTSGSTSVWSSSTSRIINDSKNTNTKNNNNNSNNTSTTNDNNDNND